MTTTTQRILTLPLSILLAGAPLLAGCGSDQTAQSEAEALDTAAAPELPADSAAGMGRYDLAEEVPPLPDGIVLDEAPEASAPERAPLAERAARLDQRAAELALREREAELARREAQLAAREQHQAAREEPRPAPRVEEPYEAPVRRASSVTVPAGTALEVELLETLSSETSQIGDTVRARVAGSVYEDGVAAIPAGSEIVGVVSDVQGLRRVGGRARLAVDFTELVLPSGAAVPIQASYSQVGKSETAKDAATIGGAAAAGGVLGKQIEKDRKGAVIGAILGAAAGTAIATKTRGRQITLPSGTALTLSLADSVTVIR